MSKYIAAIDQGTTSTRCILFNHQGNIVSVGQKEHEQIYPRPGWVEHNPEEIWKNTLEVIAVARINVSATASDIAAIGITNQRETTVVWNKRTGKPYYNALVVLLKCKVFISMRLFVKKKSPAKPGTFL